MYGISLDIGTSGTRGHAIDLSNGRIISTAITECHPLPGANIMDHLTFCINMGVGTAHEILMGTVNKVLDGLDIDLNKVERVGICGNPIQLSIFQNMKVDDLAFVGSNAHKSKGIVEQKRNARIIPAMDVGLNVSDKAELIVPPAIRHEIGADALAMLYKSGFLEMKENCLVTDYGTNAEMALKVGDSIFTGSAAAGPAIEGQHIVKGMLASPGAISDLEYEFQWRCKVLGEDLSAKEGDLIDISSGSLIDEGEMHGKAKGITGTGVIATASAALEGNLWSKGTLQTDNKRVDLQDGVFVEDRDISEACKAFGAIRAGHFTLLEHAGIKFNELDVMYMAGASGTYVDAVKARDVGLLPPMCGTIYQIGNTSLAMATDIVRNPELIDELQNIANGIRADHVMFATDKTFEQIYLQELAFWGEGMSMEMYNRNLEAVGIQPLPKVSKNPKVHRIAERDIPILGEKGLKILHDIGTELTGSFKGCTGCEKCRDECPESAITVTDKVIHVKTKNCLGTACYRCQMHCPEKVFVYSDLKLK